MKKKLIFLSMVVAFITTSVQTTRASHGVGFDLLYRYTGVPNQFIVTLKFYRDCSGIPAPSGSVNICYSSASCNLYGNATLLELPPFGFQVPIPPCIPNPGATTCNGGTAYGVEEHIYEGIVTLPAACNDWIFSYGDCCRNPGIVTFPPNNFYVTAKLDNLNFPTNSSPVFSNYPVTQFCVLNQFYYDQGATDIDGDSLAYFLTEAYDQFPACPAPVNPTLYIYNPGYSPTHPFDTPNGVPIAIDSLTGVVSFIPTVQQIGVMCILVKEYRQGIEIGYIRRDIQINIVGACLVSPPVVATFPVTLGGANYNGVGVQCGDSSVILTFPSNPVQCKSIEPNGTDFRILAPNGQPNPAIMATPINCQGGVTDSILIHFYYPLKYGVTYLWTKIGNDGNTLLSECGSAMAEYDTIPIVLEDTSTFSILTIQNLPCAFDSCTLTFAQALDCYSFASNGSDLILYDSNGNTFPVSGAYGVGCNVNNPNSTIFHFDFGTVVNGQSPFYLVSLTGTDSTTVANQCGRFVHPGDTIAILTVNNYLPITLGADTIICANDPLPLLNAGLTGATYTWYLNNTVIAGQTSQTLQTTSPGDYGVYVNIGASCAGSDTINVNVVAAPTVTLSNQTICDYDPLPTLDAQNPGATSYQWTLNGAPYDSTQVITTNGPGTYAVTVTVGSCVGAGTMDLIVSPSPTPVLSDTLICGGVNVTLNPQAAPTDSVFWFLNNVLIAITPTLNVSTAGVYIGMLQTSDGCRNSDTSNVTAEQPLPAPSVDCGSGGTANYKYVYTWNSVPGATGYEVSLDGGLTWQPVQPDTLYPSTVTIVDFRVRAVNTNGVCRDGNVSELAPCEVIIPNIITPNDDNINDVFYIKNLEGHPNSILRILNRWGNVVLDNSNYQNDWDGDGLADGTYYYVLKLDDGQEFTGTITILNGK